MSFDYVITMFDEAGAGADFTVTNVVPTVDDSGALVLHDVDQPGILKVALARGQWAKIIAKGPRTARKKAR